MLLWQVEVMAPLWDIYQLEKDGPRPSDALKVEKMHANIKQIHLLSPPYFRAENPDTTFDNHPDCYWIQGSRLIFQNGAAFTIMALHRPYICTSTSSRRSALEAALEILRVQREYFSMLQTKHYKMYNLVLNTFDAIILSAAIYILHPFENRDLLESTLQHFDWAMERFHTMVGRNAIANTASGVLKAINIRLKKALGAVKPHDVSTPSESSTKASTVSTNNSSQLLRSIDSQSHVSPASSTDPSTSSTTPSTQYTLPTISNLTTTNTPTASSATPNSSSSVQWDSFSASNNLNPNSNNISPPPQAPQGYDFTSIAPLQPMHDLLFNELSTTAAADFGHLGGGFQGMQQQDLLQQQQMSYATPEAWQFEGDFGSDSFWGFMNSWNP